MDFDGTQFRGVDDEATDPGSPVDTALVHYLSNGLEYIERGFDRCGLALRCRIPDFEAATLDPLARTLTSVQESSFLAVPMFFERPPEQLRLDFLSVQTAFFAEVLGYDIEIGARLECETDTFSDVITVDEDDEEYSMTLDTTSIDVGQSAILYLHCRALGVAQSGGTYSSVGAPTSTTINIHDETDIFDEGDPTADQPGTSDDWPPIISLGRVDNLETGADHVLTLDDSEMSATGISADNLQTIDNTESAQSHEMPWTYMASVHVSVDYQREYFDGSELRQNIDEESQVARRISVNQRRQHERSKLVSVGTGGTYRATDDGWPKAHRSGWTYADTDRGSSELVRESIPWMPGVDAFDIHLLIVAAGLSRPDYDTFRVGDDLLAFLQSNANRQSWSITAAIEQLQNGSTAPVSINSTERSQSFRHLPVTRSIDTPILHQSYYQEYFDIEPEYRFTYREGQLMARDDDLITPVTMTVRVPSGEIDDVPMDVIIDVESSDYDPEFLPTDGFAGSRGFDPRGRLYCVGYSIYARRET